MMKDEIKKWIFKTFAILLIMSFVWIIISLPSFKSLPEPSYETLRIGVANLSYKNKRANLFSETLQKIKCDIFVGLEWTGKNLNVELLERHGFKMILNHPRTGTHGICVIVRDFVNIQASLVQSPLKGTCRIPLGVVRFSKDQVNFTLLGVHAPPPVASCKETTGATLKAISYWVKEGRLPEDKGVGCRGDEVIIAGDMNTLPFESSIKFFHHSEMQDAYEKKNWRPGPTWSPFSWLPALFRIDYIFSSSKLEVLNSRTIRLPGSDHRAVVADIRIAT